MKKLIAILLLCAACRGEHDTAQEARALIAMCETRASMDSCLDYFMSTKSEVSNAVLAHIEACMTLDGLWDKPCLQKVGK